MLPQPSTMHDCLLGLLTLDDFAKRLLAETRNPMHQLDRQLEGTCHR